MASPAFGGGGFFCAFVQQPYLQSALYICVVGRILAIDFGMKRCGIAVTDPLQIIASPLETVDNGQLVTFIKKYLNEEEVESIVLGMPFNLDGTLSEMCLEVEKLKEKLEKKFPGMVVHTIDERFTSYEAQRVVIQSVKSKKKRRDKGLVDRISASIILQSFMNQK